MVKLVDVVGFRAGERRLDNHLTISIFMDNGKHVEYETTGKMLLKDIIKGIAKEIRKHE